MNDAVDQAKEVAATHEFHNRLDEAIARVRKESAMAEDIARETGRVDGERVAAFIRAINGELKNNTAAVAQVTAVYVALLRHDASL